MAEKRAYAILLSERNRMEKLMSDEMLDALGDKNACAFVQGGYDLSKFVGCFVFRDKAKRDAAAERMRNIGVYLVTRDNALIDEIDLDKLN